MWWKSTNNNFVLQGFTRKGHIPIHGQAGSETTFDRYVNIPPANVPSNETNTFPKSFHRIYYQLARREGISELNYWEGQFLENAPELFRTIIAGCSGSPEAVIGPLYVQFELKAKFDFSNVPIPPNLRLVWLLLRHFLPKGTNLLLRMRQHKAINRILF